MAFLLSLIPTAVSLGESLFGGHGSSSSSSASSSPTATLSYHEANENVTPNFDWQASIGDWKAIGIALVAILILGAFKPTYPLAVGIAVLIAAVLILQKVQSNATTPILNVGVVANPPTTGQSVPPVGGAYTGGPPPNV